MKLTCSDCKVSKLLAKFNKASTNRGYQRKCRSCQHTYEGKWRRANRPKKNAAGKRNRNKVSAYIKNLKNNARCLDCSVCYPYYVMDFDHLGDKKFSIAHRGNKGINRLNAEIAKCELVCANCHRFRTHKRLKTPPEQFQQ